MWIKILKYGLQAAIALGLDKKVKGWIGRKLDKADDKIHSKYKDAVDKIDGIRDEYGLWEEDEDADDRP
jgi:hypothetical protein